MCKGYIYILLSILSYISVNLLFRPKKMIIVFFWNIKLIFGEAVSERKYITYVHGYPFCLKQQHEHIINLFPTIIFCMCLNFGIMLIWWNSRLHIQNSYWDICIILSWFPLDQYYLISPSTLFIFSLDVDDFDHKFDLLIFKQYLVPFSNCVAQDFITVFLVEISKDMFGAVFVQLDVFAAFCFCTTRFIHCILLFHRICGYFLIMSSVHIETFCNIFVCTTSVIF